MEQRWVQQNAGRIGHRLDSTELWPRYTSFWRGGRSSSTCSLGSGGRYKAARGAVREQGRSKTGTASLPHVKLARMSAPGPTGERQEYLDAVISFVGAEQRRRIFRLLHTLKVKWATWDLPEECRFLLNTQLMFLKKEKEPTTKMFDDEEWIRSLTEAEAIVADIPEGK